MSSPGPQRSSFRRRFRDDIQTTFHSNPSSRSSSPRPWPSTSSNVPAPGPDEEASSVEATTHTLHTPHTGVPFTRTQSIPPGFHAHAEESTVVHTTELALTSLNISAAPLAQEPGVPVGLVDSSGPSLLQASAAIESVPNDPTIASGPGNVILPVDPQGFVPLGVSTGESHDHLASAEGASQISAGESTSRTESQGAALMPVTAFEEHVPASPASLAQPSELPSSSDSSQGVTLATSNDGIMTSALNAGSENATETEVISDIGEAIQLSRLADLSYARFSHTGDLADMEKAISALQQAIKLLPDGHKILPDLLNNLGIFFQSRFKRTGDLADIAEAISALQGAIILPQESDTTLATLYTHLPSLYQSRFERTGDLDDIAEAISAQQRAIELALAGHALLPSWLDSLGILFRLRFNRTGNLVDLAESILVQRRAIQLTPAGHVDLPGRLSNLGTSLLARFERTGDLADVTEAISAQQRAVQLAPEGDSWLPRQLSNLANSFQCRFQISGDLADISDAISAHQRAVWLTPKDHPGLPSLLRNLGNSLMTRSMATSNSEDLMASVSQFRFAAQRSTSTPEERFRAAKRWAQLLNICSPSSPEVLSAFDAAIQLLALVAGLEQTVKGRFAQLQDAAGIVLDGAAAACRLEQCDKAVEWLEQGRCLIWSQLNSLRSPMEDLRVHDSLLAQRLTDVSNQLQSASSTRNTHHPSMDASTKILVQDEAISHLALAKEWGNLLSTVRSIPGFESFLQPSPCCSLLQHLPESGAVVVINVGEDRCDAIALLRGLVEPLHIPLPNFSLKKAHEYRLALRTQLESKLVRMREVDVGSDQERGFMERPMGQNQQEAPDTPVVGNILKCLWLEVAKPILEMLGYSKYNASSDAPLVPRIWWCPTGAMSFLPIHAAGMYDHADTIESVLDYAVSSYTPTITALTDRVKNNRPIEAAMSGLFMTSQPNVQGACSIPGTTQEVRDIYVRANAHGLRVWRSEGSELTVPGLHGYMKDYSSVHLACHASQNAADPLQSRFLLHAGELRLGTIIQLNLKDADLAFLSACQTSTGEEKLPDEAVHLAAGMLAAGYRRVVATMWSIKDEHAPNVAKDFYEYLWNHREEGSGAEFDGSLSAYALHHAIQHLRQGLDNSEDSLLTWVPYVHFGY